MGTEYVLLIKQEKDEIRELSLYEMSSKFDLFDTSYPDSADSPEDIDQVRIFNDLTPEEVIKLCCEGIKSASYFMDKDDVEECLSENLKTYGG